MKLSRIEVPLVQEDLKHSDTLVQIANTLDILDQSIRNVFDHVNRSVGRTRQTLRSLETRNSVVCEQIERLKTIQKSVTIRSKGKYPYESARGNNYKIDFAVTPRLELRKVPARAEDRSESESQSKKSEASGNIENKLTFYHVKTDDMLRKNADLVCEESLGSLPANVDSITAALLFNTCDNVYERYVIVDPLSTGTKPPASRQDSAQTRKMEDAPKSLNTEDDLLLRRQSFAYSPSVEAVPVIELPADLPDLVGFADDFRYTGDTQDAAAPTSSPPRNIEHQQTAPASEAAAPSQALPSVPLSTQSKPIAPASASPANQNTSISPATPAPPPPPLPPPAPPTPPSAPAPAVTSEVPSSLHANLMEAIRSAGGSGKAKLRTVDKEPASAVLTAVPPAGDLMSDLAAKLSLRRKGISGSQQQGGKEGGSLMDKLLASIPPPPVARGEGGGSSSESDMRSDVEAEWDD